MINNLQQSIVSSKRSPRFAGRDPTSADPAEFEDSEHSHIRHLTSMTDIIQTRGSGINLRFHTRLVFLENSERAKRGLGMNLATRLKDPILLGIVNSHFGPVML